jgi:hypothetical protein
MSGSSALFKPEQATSAEEEASPSEVIASGGACIVGAAGNNVSLSFVGAGSRERDSLTDERN